MRERFIKKTLDYPVRRGDGTGGVSTLTDNQKVFISLRFIFPHKIRKSLSTEIGNGQLSL